MKNIFLFCSGVFYFLVNLFTSLEMGLIFVFSIMFSGSLFLFLIIIKFIFRGVKQKAIVKEYIKGYQYLNRRNRNSYVITIITAQGKSVNKRINYRTNITLRPGDAIEVFVDKEGEVFIKEDLYFIIPFAITFFLVSTIASILNF
jgi:hypothetical protein